MRPLYDDNDATSKGDEAVNYLRRDERRADIVEAAARVLAAQGFGAMTVRRIATEANVAVGLIHRHFRSIEELKAEAFERIIRATLPASESEDTHDAPARLLKMLCNEEAAVVTSLRLWNEAMYLAEHEPRLKTVFLQGMRDWHAAVTGIIVTGQAGGAFRQDIDASENAWRLIGMSCGLSGVFLLSDGSAAFGQIRQHLLAAMKHLQR